MSATCPFCKTALPFRRDKRGGRYFRCNRCQTAFFFSGKSVIDELDGGGTWSFKIQKDSTDRPSSILSELIDTLTSRK